MTDWLLDKHSFISEQTGREPTAFIYIMSRHKIFYSSEREDVLIQINNSRK